MDTFNHQYSVPPQLQRLARPDFFAFGEIECGDFHLFPGKKTIERFVEQRQIDGVQSFEVKLTVFIFRGFVALHEKVVHGNRHRIVTQNSQLHRQTAARGSLSRTGRTADQHHLHVSALVNHVRHTRHLLLLIGFGHQHPRLYLGTVGIFV